MSKPWILHSKHVEQTDIELYANATSYYMFTIIKILWEEVK